MSKQQLQQPKLNAGAAAEQHAAQYLQHRGFVIIATNVVFARHEVDVVAFDGATGELVGVEVKYRRSSAWGDPSLAVNRLKIRKLSQVMAGVLAASGVQCDYRIDVVAVTPNGVKHFRNVSW